VTLTGLSIAEVVILNPAEMRGQVTLGTEALDSFVVRAYSSNGFGGTKVFTTNPYSLTLESGHAYQAGVIANLDNSTDPHRAAWLQVTRSSAVMVDNQVGPTTVDFNYPTLHHINFSLDVTGGTIDSYEFRASANADTESYSAYTYKWVASQQPSSSSDWTVMIPDDQVHVYGTAYLKTPDGTQVQRILSMQTVNLLQGTANVNWQLDLTNMGQLAGSIALTPGTNIDYHTLLIHGVYNTPTEGIFSYRDVSPNGTYSINLPPGDYDVYMETEFTSPAHRSSTEWYRVTLAAGSTTPLNFTETLGTGKVSLSVSGFFSNEDLSSSEVQLLNTDSGQTAAHHYTLVNDQFEFSLVPGSWKRCGLNLGLYDNSNPQIPLNAVLYRSPLDPLDVISDPPVTVLAGATVDLGTEEVTLVRTTAYFDVQEASATDPEILLSDPRVELNGVAYNSDNTPKVYSGVRAYGSSASTSTSALTVVAEPGTYNMSAYATVNGSSTQFASQAITLLPPAQTDEGTDVSVTPVENEDLKVTVIFPTVTAGGVTTVVETPLGPEPPQGLKTTCTDEASDNGIECGQLYYDIETTAQFSSATVCIRRKFVGQVNGLAAFLRLYHYEESTAQWEELYPPANMPEPAIDCGADLAACGCADEASCGIDYNADPPVSVIMVCGVTNGFSPFAIFEKDFAFTNKVNGVVYEGPTGPPSLQTWTAPATGTYRITAIGASGASTAQSQSQGIYGGCGARVSGEFSLQDGATLSILVGQKGTAATYSAGGGGGSFVSLNGTPLLIAGGGGGVRAGATVPGRHGSVGTAGVAGSVSANYTSGFVAGGTQGLGGARASSYGSGGGGWLGNGASDGTYGEGGFSFQAGGKGGAGKSCGVSAPGGYGGGGAGNGCYGGGGGGGYSGGGGGRVGGGGGSWNAGTNTQGSDGVVCRPNGHGLVTIEYVHP
jgi:hypothetical protein